MSDLKTLATLLRERCGTASHDIARIVTEAGFRKPRVDRERLVQTLLACNDQPIMQASFNGYEDRLARWHASARVAAEKRADAILALISPPEVETAVKPELRKYTHEEMNELDRQRGIDIIDD